MMIDIKRFEIREGVVLFWLATDPINSVPAIALPLDIVLEAAQKAKEQAQ